MKRPGKEFLARNMTPEKREQIISVALHCVLNPRNADGSLSYTKQQARGVAREIVCHMLRARCEQGRMAGKRFSAAAQALVAEVMRRAVGAGLSGKELTSQSPKRPQKLSRKQRLRLLGELYTRASRKRKLAQPAAAHKPDDKRLPRMSKWSLVKGSGSSSNMPGSLFESNHSDQRRR